LVLTANPGTALTARSESEVIDAVSSREVELPTIELASVLELSRTNDIKKFAKSSIALAAGSAYFTDYICKGD
jgi:hypothetical protein